MLDELAIETAQEKSRHKEELSDLKLQHEKEVLSIRARYEKELRGLHEDKSRTEEEIRAQLREEKVRDGHESCCCRSVNTRALRKLCIYTPKEVTRFHGFNA